MSHLNEAKASMEQYIENGGHISELMEYIQILSAAHKTPLGLSQWTSSDKPVMEDFNEDNRIIDEKIRELLAGLAEKTDQSAIDLAAAKLKEEITRHGDVYDGVDLTAKFSTEIADHSSVWAWIKARIQAADWNGIHVGDYIPFTCTNRYEIKAEVAGIDTYYNYGDNSGIVPHHIDFISRDCWPDPHAFNKVSYNNGTSVSPSPWLASDLYAWLNSLQSNVPNVATVNPALVAVDYRTTGVYDKLPAQLKDIIVQKRIYAPTRYSGGGLLTNDNSGVWGNIGNLWIPTEVEVYGFAQYGSRNGRDSMGSQQYPLFCQNMKRIKVWVDRRSYWWLLISTGANTTDVATVSTQGLASSYNTIESLSVPVCFRIA